MLNTQLFPIHLNTYVAGLRLLEIFLLSQCVDRLQMSESDIDLQTSDSDG